MLAPIKIGKSLRRKYNKMALRGHLRDQPLVHEPDPEPCIEKGTEALFKYRRLES